ncbi:hypothetical protein E2C01_044840 [Portunus trituberculatus]|uniref:Uncharacterized protein n=1 Tax=Portunus trituberculatus TaxID=210409 RepID=A0A5B7G178_PORTR|nr:hypothetical protein [Portunus trituberculatus]
MKMSVKEKQEEVCLRDVQEPYCACHYFRKAQGVTLTDRESCACHPYLPRTVCRASSGREKNIRSQCNSQ